MGFEELVAREIKSVDPKQVRKVIDLSNYHGYIFHGIKREDSFSKVLKEGIKPLTPEGGYVSFWTSGERLFGVVQENRLITYDTPFFHYAYSFDGKCMNLAIANYCRLRRESIVSGEFEENGYLTIPHTVPREKIHLLRIEQKNKFARQTKETVMFEQILFKLEGSYCPNGITRVFL